LTRNLYMDYSESAERQGCHDFPGLLRLSTGAAANRGSHVMAGALYTVNGTTLYRVSATGVQSVIGTVQGSDRFIFADDGTNLYAVSSGIINKWNGSALSTVSQDVVSNPTSIAYLNRQFILGGDGGIFASSDVADGSTYNALNYAEAEIQPDALLRVYVFNQLVYLFGEKTVEQWYNTGAGNPPFARRDTSLVNVGLAGRYSVCNSDQYLYWLGDDLNVYQCVGSSARSISTSGIAHIIEGFTVTNDCIASSFVIQGQEMILFKFPTENTALVYSETYQYWIELSAGVDLDRASWYGEQITRCYGKNYTFDYRNGNCYLLDANTYTDNGDARLRVRVLPSFTAKLGQMSGQITVGRVRLNMQVGYGLTTGQGSTPYLMAEFSPDGGVTWGGQSFTPIGVLGEYRKAVDIYDFSTGYDVRLRISFSDPVPLSIFDGEVEFTEAGY
jgi:hypothetical protein